MSALSVQVPFPVFQDRDGQPLDNGYVWIGVANLNPQINPVVVYFDAALTIPAPQPLRTLNGYVSRAGTPAQIYVDGTNFSILVQDSKGSMVYNFPDGTGISAVVDACAVEYDPPFTGSVPYPVCEKLEQYVSVKDFGAVGDGVADDTAAIQAAIDEANGVFFPSGDYLVNDQIDLKSDLLLFGEGGSKIVLDAGVTPYVLRGSATNNVTIRDLEIEGNGESGFSTVYITNATNVTVDNCKITKSGATALYFVSCLFAKVQNCVLSNNFYYGLEFRDSVGCKAIANQCAENGDTGVATSVGGRGIMLWRSRGCYIAGNRFIDNTEYGFRIYSEATDTTSSYQNVVTGNTFQNNIRCDLVLYDEGAAFSFVTNNVISDNVFFRTVDTTDINAVCTLQGDFNTFVNNHIKKGGAFGTDCGFNFFNANYCTISNCSVENMDVAFSTSSSTNITIDNCLGNGVAKGLTIPTENIVVTNCKFIHGGAGLTDICIENRAAPTGKNFYENNFISGFWQGIAIGDEAVALFRNTTVGSTSVGLRKTGNVTATIEAANNSWDSVDPFLLSAYSRTGSTHDQAVLKYTGAPTTLTWTRGDQVWNEEPAVGFPIGWMCTVAGTPGTWVAMANL
jgi:parallel beta-helix repeat protein